MPRRPCPLALLAGALLENAASLSAELNTVYPGLRRVTGAAQSPAQLLGAPGLVEMEAGPAPTLLNQSEISSGFLVCAYLGRSCSGVVRGRARPRPSGGAIVTLAAATGLWSALGDGRRGVRSASTSRCSARCCRCAPRRRSASRPIAACWSLLGSRLTGGIRTARRRRRRDVAARDGLRRCATCIGCCPTSPPGRSGLARAVGGRVVAYAVTRWPSRPWPVVAARSWCLCRRHDANPVVRGRGRAAPPARRPTVPAHSPSAPRPTASLIAADSMAANALLVANGAPMLTGYQVTGPIVEEWEKVDPDREYEDVWNRGASYLYVAASTDARDDARVVEVPAPTSSSSRPTRAGWRRATSTSATWSPTIERDRALRDARSREFTWYGGPQYVYALRDRG